MKSNDVKFMKFFSEWNDASVEDVSLKLSTKSLLSNVPVNMVVSTTMLETHFLKTVRVGKFTNATVTIESRTFELFSF